MSEKKVAWDILLKIFYGDRNINDTIYYEIPMDHPIQKYWGRILSNDNRHDGQQDEIVLLLNEVLQSSGDSNE